MRTLFRVFVLGCVIFAIVAHAQLQLGSAPHIAWASYTRNAPRHSARRCARPGCRACAPLESRAGPIRLPASTSTCAHQRARPNARFEHGRRGGRHDGTGDGSSALAAHTVEHTTIEKVESRRVQKPPRRPAVAARRPGRWWARRHRRCATRVSASRREGRAQASPSGWAPVARRARTGRKEPPRRSTYRLLKSRSPRLSMFRCRRCLRCRTLSPVVAPARARTTTRRSEEP